MWVSSKFKEWFQVSKDAFDTLKIDHAAARAEADALKTENMRLSIQCDWLRLRLNQLEFERTALLEKAYQIRVPAVEIARQPKLDPSFDPRNFTGFEDVGDDIAKELGL
jgi:hypothetical protein